MTVVCVLRSGGHYCPKWVHALRRGLLRHMSLAYRSPLHDPEEGTWTFRCLSDAPVTDPSWLRLEHAWPGWWSKVEVFRPGLFEGLVLYIDLDSVVVGDPAAFTSYTGSLAMLSDFYTPKDVASGVMLFRPGEHTEAIYEAFRKDPVEVIRRHRRSDYWYAKPVTPDRLQTLFPGALASLKVHAVNGPPPGARIVCGHGRPRLDHPSAGWAHQEWASLAREAA